jgi:WD40 repeat protein
MTQEPDGVRRFGDGRALRASYDPVADRTVVATTIGLVVTTGAGAPSTLTPEMATMLATSPDGRLAALTTSAGHLLVVDLTTEQITSFDAPVDRFSSLLFAGAADVIAASPTEVVRFRLDGTTDPLLAAPDGATLGPAAVAATGELAVPVLTSSPTVATWSGDGTRTDVDLGLDAGTRLTGVTWSGDGAHLAVLYAPPDAGDVAGIWDVAARRFTGQVALPNYVAPHQVAFPTPDRMVLPNVDQVVAYDLAGSGIAAFPAGPSAVASIDASGGAAIVARLDGTITRWVVGSDPTELAPRTVTLVDHRGGPAVSVVDQVGLVRTFGPDGSPRRHLDRWAVGEATGVDIGADGSIVLATSTGAVRLLDPAGAATAAVLDRPQGDVSDVSLAPADDLVATGVSVQKAAEAWDDTIEVTELAGGTPDFTLGGEAENVTGCSFYEANVVFSPDGSLLASSSHDFTVQISPLADPDATTVLEPHVGSVLDIEFSPDGTTLLTSADDGTLRMWDVDGWHLRAEVTANPGGWYSLAYAPDGSFVAASDAAGQISLLDPATGDVTRTFTGVRAGLGDMVVTPDGRSLVAPEPDGTVGIWSIASGAVERRLQGHTLPVDALAVSADGSTVVTASQDGTVRAWPLPSV